MSVFGVLYFLNYFTTPNFGGVPLIPLPSSGHAPASFSKRPEDDLTPIYSSRSRCSPHSVCLSVCLAVRLRCGSRRKRVTYHYPRVRATVKVSNPLGDCRRHHAVECLRSSLAPKSRSDCVQGLGSRYTFRSHSSYYLVFVRLLKHFNVTHTLL